MPEGKNTQTTKIGDKRRKIFEDMWGKAVEKERRFHQQLYRAALKTKLPKEERVDLFYELLFRTYISTFYDFEKHVQPGILKAVSDSVHQALYYEKLKAIKEAKKELKELKLLLPPEKPELSEPEVPDDSLAGSVELKRKAEDESTSLKKIHNPHYTDYIG